MEFASLTFTLSVNPEVEHDSRMGYAECSYVRLCSAEGHPGPAHGFPENKGAVPSLVVTVVLYTGDRLSAGAVPPAATYLSVRFSSAAASSATTYTSYRVSSVIAPVVVAVVSLASVTANEPATAAAAPA